MKDKKENKELTLRMLKEKISKMPEEDLDKTIDDLYMKEQSKLDLLFEDSAFYIKAYWDYDD